MITKSDTFLGSKTSHPQAKRYKIIEQTKKQNYDMDLGSRVLWIKIVLNKSK